jgi:hypothetical protein
LASKKKRKRASTKRIKARVWTSSLWSVVEGKLVPGPGHPGKVKPLFQIVGEKLPIQSLRTVRDRVKSLGIPQTGVYAAHDSMGFPRYIGRGNVFWRLGDHWRRYELQLHYYSFYIVLNKAHEREIETLLIRAAGPLLQFNDKKKRVDLRAGSVRDYEAGTRFFERQRKKGAKRKLARRRAA